MSSDTAHTNNALPINPFHIHEASIRNYSMPAVCPSCGGTKVAEMLLSPTGPLATCVGECEFIERPCMLPYCFKVLYCRLSQMNHDMGVCCMSLAATGPLSRQMLIEASIYYPPLFVSFGIHLNQSTPVHPIPLCCLLSPYSRAIAHSPYSTRGNTKRRINVSKSLETAMEFPGFSGIDVNRHSLRWHVSPGPA